VPREQASPSNALTIDTCIIMFYTLGRRCRYETLSDPLQAGIRFLYYPMPTSLSASLAGCFPFREEYGVPKFRISNNDGLDSAFSPIAVCPCNPRDNGINQLHTFWFKPFSIFGLSCFYEVYQQFTYVSHTTKPTPYPPRCWQIYHRLTALIRSFDQVILFLPALDLGQWLHLTE